MRSKFFILLIGAFLLQVPVSIAQKVIAPEKVWSAEKAHEWYGKQPWLVGADYIPANAINQLEMWQADTFDPKQIDKELGWAEALGMNTARVYLHSLAYKADPSGFKSRVNEFLKITDKHKIRPVLVFFDDCWNKQPAIGKQPEKKPGVHNSGWMQDPGDPAYKVASNYPALEVYVKDVLKTFANDKRILLWDLYNEPGNSGKFGATMPLLAKVVTWAREVNPSQPITMGLWSWGERYNELNRFQLMNSDIVSYHCYDDPERHLRTVQLLKLHGKPLICTEYMARTRNSTFANTLPMLKKEKVAAISWGLVDGKSNTKYAWDTPMSDGGEPKVWFHDIFKADGTPYNKEETDLIRSLTADKVLSNK